MDRAYGIAPTSEELRHDWSRKEAADIYQLPFNDLLFRAHQIHRARFNPNEIQVSTLLSIKTGACPEDCAYCPQSAHYPPGRQVERLLPLEEVLDAARAARQEGATRFCMGAAWRSPKQSDLQEVVRMVEEVKALGLETCVTLGMLEADQARQLKNAGLDYYNHNLDTSPEYYGQIVSTRSYRERLDTLAHVRDAGINVCCGGILGMGEGVDDRLGLLVELATMPRHPESVPINLLVQVEGTPLAGTGALDPFEFVRTVALARILMPASYVRLSAGREEMSDEMQALCFFAGANSIFYGEKLLTTNNPTRTRDRHLMRRLGITPKATHGANDSFAVAD